MKQSLGLFGARALMFSGVALAFWWFSLDRIILPLSQQLAGRVLASWFSTEGVQVLITSTGSWVMDTRFLMEPPPYSRTLETYLDVTAVSMGLPLFWCLCIGFWDRNQVRNLLAGTLLILLVLNLTYVLMGAHQIYRVMGMEQVMNVYVPVGMTIAPVDPPSAFFTGTVGIAANILEYCSLFLLPLTFAFHRNRRAIRSMIKK